MKYCLSTRDFQMAQAVFHRLKTQVTIQSFSITSTSQYFLVLTPRACNIFSYWLVEDSAMAALKAH